MEVVRTHARRWAFRVSLGLATLMLGPKCVTVAWAGSAPSVTPSPAVKLKTLSVTDWVGDRVLTEPVLDSLLAITARSPTLDTFWEPPTGVGNTGARAIDNPFIVGGAPKRIPNAVDIHLELEQSSYAWQPNSGSQFLGIWLGGFLGGAIATKSDLYATVEVRLTARMSPGSDSIVCIGVGSLPVNLERVSRQRAITIAAHRAVWSGMYSMATALKERLHLQLRSTKKDMDLKEYGEHVDQQFEQ